MRTATRVIAPAAILFLGAGCATADSLRTTAFGGEAVVQEAAVVEVENNNLADMRIYALGDGAREWLGRVPSLTTRKFQLPAKWVGADPEIRLVADASASSDDYRSEPFRVRSGQTVEFQIGDAIAHSRIAIWNRRSGSR